jgi:hypothetical protein
VPVINPNDTTTGTATAITQYNIGNNSVLDVEVEIIVGGNYIRNTGTKDADVTIAKPGAASAVTGTVGVDLGDPVVSGGYLATSRPGYLDLNADVHYNKSGTNPQGSVTLTFTSYNKPDGSADTVQHTYFVKSNSISELTFPGPGGVSFSAKANVKDAAGVKVDSSATLQVTADSTGKLVSISVNSKNGGLWLSSAWDGAKTVPKVVVDGQLVVSQ